VASAINKINPENANPMTKVFLYVIFASHNYQTKIINFLGWMVMGNCKLIN